MPEEIPADLPIPAAVDLSKTPTLTAALVKTIVETPWVEYTKPEKGGGINYEYLSEEDIVKALRKTLPANGLTVIPVKMTLVSNENYNSGNGGRMVNRLICVRYRLSHTSGEYIEGEAMGEGSDRGDKSINKAMTGAFKYFLRELTLLAGGMDPDRTSSDELARVAKVSPRATGSAATTQQSKPAPQKQAAPTKSLDDRAKDAKSVVAKAPSHSDLKNIAKQVTSVFASQPKLRDDIFRACASRATLLFIGELSQADDLETVEAIVKAAVRDEVGTDNLTKIKAAADKRNEEIAGSSGDGEQPGDSDAPPEINF